MTEDEAPIDFPAILIRLTLHEIDKMSENDIYEATRKFWRIAEHRRNGGPGAPNFAIAIYEKQVIAVYHILWWEPSEDRLRWRFVGGLDRNKTDLLYSKSVAHLFRQGEQNPIKYINCSSPEDATCGVEDLVEAIINRLHFEKSKHPHYWSLKIDLLRAGLGLSATDQEGYWLEDVLNGISRLTTRILPTDGALELSDHIPIGAATFSVYRDFSSELARMRADLIEINREFLSVLISSSLEENATRRVPFSALLEAGLPESEPSWDVIDWMENY